MKNEVTCKIVKGTGDYIEGSARGDKKCMQITTECSSNGVGTKSDG